MTRCTIVVEAVALGDEDLAALAANRVAGAKPGNLPGSVAIGHIATLDADAIARGLKAGDRVAIRRAELDHDAPCLWQREVAVPGSRLHPLPARWKLDRAMAAPSLAFAMRTVRAVPFVSTNRHAVIGLSPAGLFVVRLLAERGATSITAVDGDASRRHAARAFGATDMATPDAVAKAALTEPAGTFDTIYVMSADGAEFAATCRAIGHVGTVVAAGAFAQPDIVIADYYREIIIKESTIIGVSRTSADDWAAAIAYLDLSTTRIAGPFLTMPAEGMLQERLEELVRSGLSTGTTCVVFDR